MPLMPPIRGTPKVSPTQPAPTGDARVTRPSLPRHAPIRVAPPPSAAQASEGLDAAYAVVERYLEEGRRYVDGQGRWNGAAATSLPLDGLLGLLQRLLSPRLPIPATDELVRLATWLTQQLATAAQPPTVSRDETSTAPPSRPPWAMPYNPNPPGATASTGRASPAQAFEFTPSSASSDAAGSLAGPESVQLLDDAGPGPELASMGEFAPPRSLASPWSPVSPNITVKRPLEYNSLDGAGPSRLDDPDLTLGVVSPLCDARLTSEPK